MPSDQKKTISYDAKSFTIKGNRELLIGGEFHYFRTPNELWEDRVIKMKRSGANLITTYIPWNWHEQFEGKESWTGDRDLCSFIELCTSHGLFMIVKPGPYCCAELDFGGHPDWLLSKKIPLRRLNDQYLSYVEKWYKKVAEVINPYLVTNGGNVFCIQVENEYDHLLEYGDDKIPLEEAITYFNRLIKIMDDNKINIPKFANEANFLRGKGIIDTRTYYPNIPFFTGWNWQFEHYDDKIMSAKKGQPDCPTMILELQKGWFGMHGHPFYFPGLDHTQGVVKSSLIVGASVLNLYMYVGGTTFPFWGSRGDAWATDRWGTKLYLNPIGMGLTTSFDFGGSVIREWGELLPEGYDWLKAFNLFARDFKEFLLESDNVDEIKTFSGGDHILIIKKGSSKTDTELKDEIGKFRILTKKYKDQYLTCIRNLSDEERVVNVGWKKSGEIIFNGLLIKAHETLMFPVHFKIPETSITILSSTSELLFAKKIGLQPVFGLYGKTYREGETVLDVPTSSIKILSGKASITGKDKKSVIKYSHEGIILLQVDNLIIFIFEEKLAGKIEELKDGILVADTYFIRDVNESEDSITLKTEMLNGSENRFTYFSLKELKSASVHGTDIPLIHKDLALKQSSFSHSLPKENPVQIEWDGNWRVLPDTEEINDDFDDSQWMTLDKPLSLEEAGLLEHGYIWYRTEFDLPELFPRLSLLYPGNNNDRQYIYLNGKLVWRGITPLADIDIQKIAVQGKNRIAVLYENFYHNKSHPHEGDILKYSGILRPIVIQGEAAGKQFTKEISRFKVRQSLTGIIKGFTDMNFNDSKWQELEIKSKYIMEEEVGTILWMRRKFKLKSSAHWKFAVKLTIPEALHRCFMFVNGKPIGWFESVGPQFDFYVPETYLKENNVLALILEGPRGVLVQPEWNTFFESKEVVVNLKK